MLLARLEPDPSGHATSATIAAVRAATKPTNFGRSVLASLSLGVVGTMPVKSPSEREAIDGVSADGVADGEAKKEDADETREAEGSAAALAAAKEAVAAAVSALEGEAEAEAFSATHEAKIGNDESNHEGKIGSKMALAAAARAFVDVEGEGEEPTSPPIKSDETSISSQSPPTPPPIVT